MNLLIDIGNTQVKVALGQPGEIRRLQSLDVANPEPLTFLLKSLSGIDNCIVVCSRGISERMERRTYFNLPGVY